MPDLFRLEPPDFHILEKQIEKSILSFLRMKGIFVFKVNTVGIYDKKIERYRKSNSPFILKGVSDILGILKPDGRMLAIEVKTKQRQNRLSREQKAFLESINQNGGLAFVATSLDDVIKNMKDLL